MLRTSGSFLSVADPWKSSFQHAPRLNCAWISGYLFGTPQANQSTNTNQKKSIIMSHLFSHHPGGFNFVTKLDHLVTSSPTTFPKRSRNFTIPKRSPVFPSASLLKDHQQELRLHHGFGRKRCHLTVRYWRSEAV